MVVKAEMGPATVVVLDAQDELTEMRAQSVRFTANGPMRQMHITFNAGEADRFTRAGSLRHQSSAAVKLHVPEARFPGLNTRTALCCLCFPLADKGSVVTARTHGEVEPGSR